MDDKKIVFEKGHCLNCDTPIVYGILCAKCTPPATFKTTGKAQPISKAIVTREVKIAEMEIGDVGFTEEYAVFEVNSKLYLIGSAKISLQSEGYKTVRITCRKNHYDVDARTIHPDDIWLGWPQTMETDDYLPAKLV